MNLRNRHFLKLLDFAPTDLRQLLLSASTLKRLQAAGHERATIKGKDVALLFQGSRPSVRWTSQVAASRVGLNSHTFEGEATGLSENSSVVCSGRQLGRLFQGLVVSDSAQERVEELARTTGVPVINLGSPEFQPLSTLADLLTMTEGSSKPLEELSVLYLGDGTTSHCRSFLVGAAKFGLDARFCGPKSLQPEEALTETCLALAAETSAQIRIFSEPEEAIKGVDYVITHSWGLEKREDWEAHAKGLLPFRVNSDLLAQSGGGCCRVLHHLPVMFSEDSEFASNALDNLDLDGLEMSRELFESTSNLSFEQAENRLHCCKAVFVAVLS